ncbi:MAG: carbon-nitrogen hydrolase family protein [Planctomycetes bacterium]|nr:carbon-nitrogen hydrolase family protein [Planctomycetota bacterium]
MARPLDLAVVHFNKSDHTGAPTARESALTQFRAACERLDGTGVGLVVTCEGMESVAQTVADAESPARPGPLIDAYAGFARRNRCTVVGSVKLAEDGRVYNAQAVIGPDGAVLGAYRKTFLTTGEVKMGLARGPGAAVVDSPAGRIGGAICFDLNYEELRLAYRPLHVDVLAFSSMFHGGHMQQTWAYETRAFFAGACKDVLSEIRDPLGRVLASANGYSLVARARINLDRVIVHLDGNQDRFAAIQRAWGAGVRIEGCGALGVALVTCERADRGIADLVREFGLVPLDAYLDAGRG